MTPSDRTVTIDHLLYERLLPESQSYGTGIFGNTLMSVCFARAISVAQMLVPEALKLSAGEAACVFLATQFDIEHICGTIIS